MTSKFCSIILILVVLSGGNGHSHANSFFFSSEDDDIALDQFRDLTADIAYREFMKSDGYLKRWLKETNNDVEEALVQFEKALEWRKHHNVDKVVFEDFSTIDRPIPYSVDAFDKDGRPVVWVPFGEVDVRKVVVAGAQAKYRRFLTRMYEIMEIYLHQLSSTNPNATQVVTIYDLRGFNIHQGGCYVCLKLVPDIVADFGNYPGLVHKAFLINSPQIFDKALNVARSFMSESARQTLVVFGHDRNEWIPALHEHIDKDQLPIEYGGSKPSYKAQSSKLSHLNALANLVEQAKEAVRRDLLSPEDHDPETQKFERTGTERQKKNNAIKSISSASLYLSVIMNIIVTFF